MSRDSSEFGEEHLQDTRRLRSGENYLKPIDFDMLYRISTESTQLTVFGCFSCVFLVVIGNICMFLVNFRFVLSFCIVRLVSRVDSSLGHEGREATCRFDPWWQNGGVLQTSTTSAYQGATPYYIIAVYQGMSRRQGLNNFEHV